MRLGLIVAIMMSFTLGAGIALWQFGDRIVPVRRHGLRIRDKALVGGAFSLVDHTGKRVTQADFLGRYTLIYFGFTNCPDICPGELQTMSAAIDALGSKASKVTPILITIDPEHDTPEQLASYVGLFHPRMVGLTGTPAEVRKAARAYRVYYQKVEDTSLTSGYTMDHSSIIYLMDTKGLYLAHFGLGTNAEAMADTLQRFVK